MKRTWFFELPSWTDKQCKKNTKEKKKILPKKQKKTSLRTCSNPDLMINIVCAEANKEVKAKHKSNPVFCKGAMKKGKVIMI